MFTYAPSAWTDGIPVLEYIRFQLGDTDVDHAELMDEEIQGVLLLFDGAVKRATVECARGILAKLSRETDTTGVGITANRSQRFDNSKSSSKDLKRSFPMKPRRSL